jgi:geranylgeranyl pyrophosphate synthase
VAVIFESHQARVLEVIESHFDPSLDFSLKKHCLKLAQYGMLGGKHSRGIVACSAFLELTGLSPTDPRAAAGFLLGWALEILQAAFHIADDFMDKSEMRRNQTFRYLLPNVGSFAAFDALTLENCAFFVTDELRKHWPDAVIDELEDKLRWCNAISNIGQTYDTLTMTHTWLSCRSLELCNTTQREILTSSFGHDEEAARSIYEAVNVKAEYESYESETREGLQARVEQLSGVYPKAKINALLKSLTKRRR